MCKANQKLNGLPDDSGGMDRKETAQTKSRAGYWIGLCLIVSMAMLVGPASAEVNWTELTALLEGVVTIFPSIANMVGEIIPVLFYLIVVAFVMRFFNSIIHMIEGVTNIFK